MLVNRIFSIFFRTVLNLIICFCLLSIPKIFADTSSENGKRTISWYINYGYHPLSFTNPGLSRLSSGFSVGKKLDLGFFIGYANNRIGSHTPTLYAIGLELRPVFKYFDMPIRFETVSYNDSFFDQTSSVTLGFGRSYYLKSGATFAFQVVNFKYFSATLNSELQSSLNLQDVGLSNLWAIEFFNFDIGFNSRRGKR